MTKKLFMTGAVVALLSSAASAQAPQTASALGGGSWWQKIEAGVDLATAKQALLEREGAKFIGISEECDYNEVLSTVRDGAKELVMIKNLQTEKNGGKWGLPVADVKQMVLHVAEMYAHVQSIKAEKKGIMETIEQMCQSSVQQDDVKRQLDLVQLAHEGTEAKFSKIFADYQIDKVERADTDKALDTKWDAFFTDAFIPGALGADASFREGLEILKNSHLAANEYQARLTTVRKLLAISYLQLHIQSDANGTCPGGPPVRIAAADAEVLDFGNGVVRKSCGPKRLEETQPVMTQIENLKAQAQALTLAAQAHMLLAQAIGLTQMSTDLKGSTFARQTVIHSGF